jgi:hypothetical protein
MFYELRHYFNCEFRDYDIIYNGTIEEIAEFLWEYEMEKVLELEQVKLFAISESPVNKSLLDIESSKIEIKNAMILDTE